MPMPYLGYACSTKAETAAAAAQAVAKIKEVWMDQQITGHVDNPFIGALN